MGSLNAIAVGTQALVSLIINKVIAEILGPGGIALIGNLKNFSTTIQSIGRLGLYNGIVKYAADFKEDDEQYKKMWTSCFYICLASSMLVSLILWIGASFWSQKIFYTPDYEIIIKSLSVVLPIYTFNSLLLGIINGWSRYKKYLLINISMSVISLIITLLLIFRLNLEGAFLAIILNPGISLIVTIIILRKSLNDIIKIPLKTYFSIDHIINLGNYSAMALFSSVIGSTILIWIRNYIISSEGIDEAGYWEGMRGISNQYMIFVSTLISLYLLPRLSAIKETKDFKKEIWSFYKMILPVFLVGLLIIFFLRNFIIEVLLSDQFLPIKDLFKWQLAGDFFKVLSYVLACQFIAKKMIWNYLISEFLSFSFLYIVSMYLIDSYGFIGATIGYTLDYIFYFLVLIILLRKQLF